MLYSNRSRLATLAMAAALPSAIGAIVSGMALVTVIQDGVGYVKPSTGGAAEMFAGVAGGPDRSLGKTRPRTVLFSPAAGNLVLTIPGDASEESIRVVDIATGTSPTTAFATGSVTFLIGDAGKTFAVSYRSNTLITDIWAHYPGWVGAAPSSAEEQTGQYSIVREGNVVTDCYATGEDWSFDSATNAQVRIGADGLFYPGNTNTGTLIVAELVRGPTVSDNTIEISFR